MSGNFKPNEMERFIRVVRRHAPDAKPSEFLIHPNGGGFVRVGASVHDTAFVGETAVVISKNAFIWDFARVEGEAVVGGEVRMKDYAVIRGKAQAIGNAQLIENSILEGNAVMFGGEYPQLSGYAIVGGRCRISGNRCEIKGTSVFDGDIIVFASHVVSNGANLKGRIIVALDKSVLKTVENTSPDWMVYNQNEPSLLIKPLQSVIDNMNEHFTVAKQREETLTPRRRYSP